MDHVYFILRNLLYVNTEDVTKHIGDDEVVVYLEEEQAVAIKRDFQQNIRYAQNTFQEPLPAPPEPEVSALKKGEKPDRKDARRLRLALMAARAQAFVAGFMQITDHTENWYSLLRLRCSDSNGAPLWKKTRVQGKVQL